MAQRRPKVGRGRTPCWGRKSLQAARETSCHAGWVLPSSKMQGLPEQAEARTFPRSYFRLCPLLQGRFPGFGVCWQDGRPLAEIQNNLTDQGEMDGRILRGLLPASQPVSLGASGVWPAGLLRSGDGWAAEGGNGGGELLFGGGGPRKLFRFGKRLPGNGTRPGEEAAARPAALARCVSWPPN